ncbi:hypothetical protein [Actinophytocola sp.]
MRCSCVAEFTVAEGDRVGLRLAWRGLHQPDPADLDAAVPMRGTER